MRLDSGGDWIGFKQIIQIAWIITLEKLIHILVKL